MVEKMSKGKELLFSITKKDFEIQTFRSGGKGGQHQNTTESGVRIIHLASGARGESREERKQGQNKKNALDRLVKTKIFQNWLRIEAAKRAGVTRDIDIIINEAMEAKNLRVEGRQNNKWEILQGDKDDQRQQKIDENF